MIDARNLHGRSCVQGEQEESPWRAHSPIEAPFISEPLIWIQICERYPNEWVCLVEMEELTDTDLDFHTARVVGHGKTRREPLEQARPFVETHESMGHLHPHSLT